MSLVTLGSNNDVLCQITRGNGKIEFALYFAPAIITINVRLGLWNNRRVGKGRNVELAPGKLRIKHICLCSSFMSKEARLRHGIKKETLKLSKAIREKFSREHTLLLFQKTHSLGS